MPIDWTELERIGVLIGEAITDDVAAWSEPIELDGAARFVLNKGGTDYEITIRRAGRVEDVA